MRIPSATLLVPVFFVGVGLIATAAGHAFSDSRDISEEGVARPVSPVDLQSAVSEAAVTSTPVPADGGKMPGTDDIGTGF